MIFLCPSRICNDKIRHDQFCSPQHLLRGARGSVVDSGTMLQARRSRVRVPMRWVLQLT
jgi:hypothetical protein